MQQKAISYFIEQALAEDIGNGDITTLATIHKSNMGEAECYVKENCIIAGVVMAELICNFVDPTLAVEFNVQDGDEIKAIRSIGKIKGKIHAILKLERLLLNCMQRMSAIASKTNNYVKLIEPYKAKILDTRKTTPNFRMIEKWAVQIGGGVNHRFGLYDQILIKDNHIQAAGCIKNAIVSCINYLDQNAIKIPVIVEVKNLDEFNIAKEFEQVDRILVDNFSPAQINDLLVLNNTNKLIEASGGINASNIVEYAKTGVDFVSVGDLTHHVSSVDISLKIV